MNFKLEQIGAIDIISVGGRLAFDASAEFEANLREAVNEAVRNKVILDFEGVTFISSPVLRSILSLAKRLSRHGSKLFVIGASEEVIEVFRVSGFTKLKVFELGDRETAIKALESIPDPSGTPVVSRAKSSGFSMPPLPVIPPESETGDAPEDQADTAALAKAAAAAKAQAAAAAAKAAEDARAKAAAAKAQAEAEARAKAAAEQAKAEEEAKAQAAAAAKAEQEAQAKAAAEQARAEEAAQAAAEEEARAKAAAEAAQAGREAAARVAEAEEKARAIAIAEAEEFAKAQAAAKAKEEAKAAAQAEEEARVKADAAVAHKAAEQPPVEVPAKAVAQTAKKEATVTPTSTASEEAVDDSGQSFFGSIVYAMKYWLGRTGEQDKAPKRNDESKSKEAAPEPAAQAKKDEIMDQIREAEQGGLVYQVKEAFSYWTSKLFRKKK
ncbi:MAG: STAS domain-containing protein [Verrucomicrobiae bacterium]|nr:STAS domain-containing protein [Verrucomicrobiae bacterium]